MADGAFGSIGNLFAPYPVSPPSPLASLPADDDASLEPEAALYLANHVAKVKLEAAEAHYKWSSQVDQLTSQNRHLTQEVEKLERVVRENSLQWRLRERDDWKNLVAAVQRDRDRLEADNEKITSTVNVMRKQLQAAGIEPDGAFNATGASPPTSPVPPSATNTDTTTTTTTTINNVPHPNADNVPQATMMRFKELEAQLAEALTREDRLRRKLNTCENELQLWKVEKQADFDNTVLLLQSKLNVELEQKFMRKRGYRPLQSPIPNKSSGGRGGLISRMVEVIAPYPPVEYEARTTLLNMAMETEEDEKTSTKNT